MLRLQDAAEMAHSRGSEGRIADAEEQNGSCCKALDSGYVLASRPVVMVCAKRGDRAASVERRRQQWWDLRTRKRPQLHVKLGLLLFRCTLSSIVQGLQ